MLIKWTVFLKLLCHVEEMVTEVPRAESQCHHGEMSTCLQETMAIALKTGKFLHCCILTKWFLYGVGSSFQAFCGRMYG